MASSRSTRFVSAVTPADVVSSRRVSAASASGSASGNAPSASRRSSTIVSMRELDSMKCRCSAASSCSLSERLAVADSTPRRELLDTLRKAGEHLVGFRQAVVERLLRHSCPEPVERLDPCSEHREHRPQLVRRRTCRSASCDFSDSSSAACPSRRSFVPVAVDASSSSCRLMPGRPSALRRPACRRASRVVS